MKTIFEKIDSESELPENVVRNLTRPNLFGHLYTDDNLEIKQDLGVLGVEENVNLFQESLNNAIVSVLNEDFIDYITPYGGFTFERKANVTLYYLKSKCKTGYRPVKILVDNCPVFIHWKSCINIEHMISDDFGL